MLYTTDRASQSPREFASHDNEPQQGNASARGDIHFAITVDQMLVEADQLKGSSNEDGAVDNHGVVFVAGAPGLRLETKERGCICIYTRGSNGGGEVLAMAEISGCACGMCGRTTGWA
jgi:hypothetical protein